MKTLQRKPSATIERNYRASANELWDLWTTKAGFESWWGPEGFCTDVHEIEPKAAGALHYTMRAATPEMIAAMQSMGSDPHHEVRARFSEFQPCRQLTLLSVVDFLPGVEVYESQIDVTFTAVQNGTRMVVTLYGMHSPDFTEMQKAGFTSQLGKLDRRYEA
jgi:uncharacterized protein YndB with AHSA1/START domain